MRRRCHVISSVPAAAARTAATRAGIGRDGTSGRWTRSPSAAPARSRRSRRGLILRASQAHATASDHAGHCSQAASVADGAAQAVVDPGPDRRRPGGVTVVRGLSMHCGLRPTGAAFTRSYVRQLGSPRPAGASERTRREVRFACQLAHGDHRVNIPRVGRRTQLIKA
jgi:hypothetical protein